MHSSTRTLIVAIPVSLLLTYLIFGLGVIDAVTGFLLAALTGVVMAFVNVSIENKRAERRSNK